MVLLRHVKATTTKILTHRTTQKTQERVNSDHLLSCTEWGKTSSKVLNILSEKM